MEARYKRNIEAMFKTTFPNCTCIHLTTYPKYWRHCCGTGGLQVLKPLKYVYNGLTVNYIYCGYCNQIIYYMG